MTTIDKFSGDFAFLSNFHPSPITIDGITFPTVEHAFQAQKSLDPDDRRRIAALDTPGKAKRAGRKVQLRPDWEQIKIEIMRQLLALKFADPTLREQLKATGNAALIEGNTWGDRFWGVCKGKGQNHLGRLLSEIRETI